MDDSRVLAAAIVWLTDELENAEKALAKQRKAWITDPVLYERESSRRHMATQLLNRIQQWGRIS
jgi:hydroxyethylthiazole kinase-like sugar kinase family protein